MNPGLSPWSCLVTELQEGPGLEPELCYPWLDVEGTEIQLSNTDSCLSNARGEATSRVREALIAVSLSHFPDRKYVVMLAAPLALVQPSSCEEADCACLGSGLPIWGWKETA